MAAASLLSPQVGFPICHFSLLPSSLLSHSQSCIMSRKCGLKSLGLHLGLVDMTWTMEIGNFAHPFYFLDC